VGARFVLLYDADCGLCTFFAGAVKVADLGGRIEPMALADPRADPWFARAAKEERFGSFHIVRPSGDRLSRGRALIALVEALPLGAGLSRLASGIPFAVAAAESVYAFSVRYRDFLAGLPTTPEATSAASGSV